MLLSFLQSDIDYIGCRWRAIPYSEAFKREAITSVEAYIDSYNNNRIHSAFGLPAKYSTKCA